MSETLTLLNRKAKLQEFWIPKGWRHKANGTAQRGDRWWRWIDESWQPVEEHAFLGSPVGLLQAVISPDEAKKL